ncbi:MAG: ribosome maturation factor RimM [Muribaculaceae bacterium]|nr:ribosome maturation factor RimM [Muribaculaceae bacterium]
MTDSNKILVGKIVAPHGIRGDVRVQTYTAHPNDLQKLMILSDKFESSDFKFVRRLNPTSDVIIAHITGFDDRTSVEGLRGTELFISRNALPDVRDGEYYQADLIGFDVLRNGKKIGIIDCFQNFGAGDIIELDNGDMISFSDVIVDMANKQIKII